MRELILRSLRNLILWLLSLLLQSLQLTLQFLNLTILVGQTLLQLIDNLLINPVELIELLDRFKLLQARVQEAVLLD